MRCSLALVIAAACSGPDRGPTTIVIAFEGNVAASGAVVISHRADGSPIDRVQADAEGRAELLTETGAYVTAIFPAALQASTDAIEIVTTPAAPPGQQVVVHGPPPPRVPQVVGALAVTAPALTADHVDVDLGCLTATVPALPATLDISSACIGADPSLDVLVIARDSNDGVLGYAAARVPFVAGAANFDIAAWATAGTTVPIALDGVLPAIELDELSDTFVYPALVAADHAQLWDGLVVAGARTRARLGFATLGRTTTRFASTVPATIAFGAADFAEQIEPTLLLSRTTLAATWTALAAGDATALHVAWQPATTALAWDALLPPDATAITFPALDADLAARVPLPGAIDIAVDLRSVDSSDLDGFAAAQAAELHYDTLVPAPTDGTIRESNASGFN